MYLPVDDRIASSSNRTSMEKDSTEANDNISKPMKIKDEKKENSQNNPVSLPKPKTKLSKDG